MIKAVIFDLFGTLTNGKCNPEEEIIKTFNLKPDISDVEKLVCGTYFKNWDSYLDIIIKILDLPDTNKTKGILLDIFKNDFAKEEINSEMINQIKILKSEGIKLGLLSNIPNPLYDIIRKNNLEDYFDEILYSFNECLIKPDLNFFNLILFQLNVKPSEVIMVGNSLRSDIEPAKKLGLNTIHFKDVIQLKKELVSFFV
jgi:HAD superfamily hydrolase (TIGR01549 family)